MISISATEDCQRCRAEAFSWWIANPEVWVPECDGAHFAPMQKHVYKDKHGREIKQAFCVNQWGEEWKKSRTDGDTVNCDDYKGTKSVHLQYWVMKVEQYH